MFILQFTLNIYFAAVLGIAGIAKINNSPLFIHALQYQYKISSKDSVVLGKIFPWIEIFLAASLLIPIVVYRFIATIATLLIFLIFFLSKVFLIINNRFHSGCGCYGETIQKQNALESIVALIIQIILALVLIFTMIFYSSLPWQYYFGSSILLMGFYSWLLWKLWKTQRASVAGNN